MVDNINYKAGDRVKVTIEGVIASNNWGHWPNANDWGIDLILDNDLEVSLANMIMRDDNVSVEVLTPPLVQFEAGDRVRSKTGPGFEYTLGSNGYFCHTTNTLNVGKSHLACFKSDRYEKVN